MPNKIHQWIVTRLVMCLNGWSLPRRAGVALVSGYEVRIRDDRGVMPDVQFFRRGGRPLPGRGLDHGAPDLAVEVASPSSIHYDRVVELAWYASIGTPEYCIVDPAKQSVERFLLAADGTLQARRVAHGRGALHARQLPRARHRPGAAWTMPDL